MLVVLSHGPGSEAKWTMLEERQRDQARDTDPAQTQKEKNHIRETRKQAMSSRKCGKVFTVKTPNYRGNWP